MDDRIKQAETNDNDSKNSYIEASTKQTSVEANLEKNIDDAAVDAKLVEQEDYERKASLFNIIQYVRLSWRRYKIYWCLAIWLAITGYFVASVALKRKTKLSDVLPFVFIYVFISFRMLFAFTGTSFIVRPVSSVCGKAMGYIMRAPRLVRYILAAALLLTIALSVSLSLPTGNLGSRIDRMHSLLGIVVILCLLTLTSKHPRSIQWRTVLVGMLLQFCLGCIVVKTTWGLAFFTWMANRASDFLSFSRYGAKFVFGDDVGTMAIFAMSVFPAVIFFAAFIQT
ncbi:hypothetical protein GGI23_001286, partial [Coemansia sp. RSA 2559]